MNTRKLRKAILTLCSALLLVSLSVGITVAYLTSTDEVKNTFTVGQVKITLDEAKLNDKYQPIKTTTNNDGTTTTEVVENSAGADRVQKNSYKLMPGHTYIKDPTIHIDDSSEEAYLRVKVQVSNTAKVDALFQETGYAEEKINEILVGFTASDWKVASNTVTDNVRTYVLQYKETITGKTRDIVLFKSVKVPDEFDNDDIIELNNTTLTITAEAIQSAGFENATEAWKAFDYQAKKQ